MTRLGLFFWVGRGWFLFVILCCTGGCGGFVVEGIGQDAAEGLMKSVVSAVDMTSGVEIGGGFHEYNVTNDQLIEKKK